VQSGGNAVAVATQPPAAAVVKQPPAPAAQGAVHLAVSASETATRAAGPTVAVLKTATHSASNVVVPVVSTVVQSGGNAVAAATNVTHSSATQTVVNLANSSVATAPQRLLPSAPTAEHLSRAVTHADPYVGGMSHSRAINVPSSGSGPITSSTMPAAASHGGTFSGTGASAVPVGGSRPGATSRCGPAGAEDRLIGGCGAGAARPPTFLVALPFGQASAAIVSRDGLAAGGAPTAARGGSAADGAPGSVAPSPAPGGITGPAAAASGLALSTFLTLAGLLLLGGPRVMRLLRLFSEPWCSARFVLMPERPG
jgi:hypothetical protein